MVTSRGSVSAEYGKHRTIVSTLVEVPRAQPAAVTTRRHGTTAIKAKRRLRRIGKRYGGTKWCTRGLSMITYGYAGVVAVILLHARDFVFL